MYRAALFALLYSAINPARIYFALASPSPIWGLSRSIRFPDWSYPFTYVVVSFFGYALIGVAARQSKSCAIGVTAAIGALLYITLIQYPKIDAYRSEPNSIWLVVPALAIYAIVIYLQIRPASNYYLKILAIVFATIVLRATLYALEAHWLWEGTPMLAFIRKFQIGFGAEFVFLPLAFIAAILAERWSRAVLLGFYRWRRKRRLF